MSTDDFVDPWFAELQHSIEEGATREELDRLRAQRRRCSVFGEAIFAGRCARGISQRRLAEMTGVTAANISRIEGGLQNPTADTLLTLADALGIEFTVVQASADRGHGDADELPMAA